MAGYGRAGVAAAIAALTIGNGVADAAPAGSEWGASTSRVSVNSSGRQANSDSFEPAISAHGRYVAFGSQASNLVAGDTHNGDVFLRDRLAQVTRLVSVSSTGERGNGESGGAAISASGRYVAFVSSAPNLVAGDNNGSVDVFVRDVVAATTRRVSVGPGGRQANGDSYQPVISANGLHVAFFSYASNLVSGDSNQAPDVFVRDLLAGVTQRMSVGRDGRQANGYSEQRPAVSANGRFVAFASEASNLVPRDTNDTVDVFVRDRLARVTRRVSVGPGGRQANDYSSSPTISADGRFIAFGSHASNFAAEDTNREPDVFVRDRQAGITRRVSVGPADRQANGFSLFPSISADGRYVTFTSGATNLVSGDTNGENDVFVRDRLAGITRRVSVGPGGRQANGYSNATAISADGRHVSFISFASNLVPGDTNSASDVFVRDEFGDGSTTHGSEPAGLNGR